VTGVQTCALPISIEENVLSAAIWLGSVSIAAGLVSAAAMTE
jgi:uncharacterized membrane protein YjfL (UPF0719 family)